MYLFIFPQQAEEASRFNVWHNNTAQWVFNGMDTIMEGSGLKIVFGKAECISSFLYMDTCLLYQLLSDWPATKLLA